MSGRFDFIDTTRARQACEQGSTFHKMLTYKNTCDGSPIDLTGFDAKMQIRSDSESATIVFELSTENGRITIDENKIHLLISNTETLTIPVGRYVYDLVISSAGTATRLLEGYIDVKSDVTR
jgi:hypothetical protein